MTKPDCAYAKTKAKISTLVFATQIVQFLDFLNPRIPAFSHLLALFVSDLVGNPETVFFPIATQIVYDMVIVVFVSL